MGLFNTWDILIILGVTLIVFGPQKLPEVARYLAKAIRMFREASREIQQQIEMADWDLERSLRSKNSSSSNSYDESSSATHESTPVADQSTQAAAAIAEPPATDTYGYPTVSETQTETATASVSGASVDSAYPPMNSYGHETEMIASTESAPVSGSEPRDGGSQTSGRPKETVIQADADRYRREHMD